jgi:putative ABC transport system substrate-binding protein
MITASLRRRDFIALGGAGVVCPLAAHAQQRPAIPVVGFLDGASAWEFAHLAAAFRQGLSETGHVEGRNVLVEYRWAEGHYERLPQLAADLVRRQVAVIATGGNAALRTAKAATTTIPIVFRLGNDPVANGFVASLNRPGGNITGVTTLTSEVGPKRLELLRELLPTAATIGLLINPANPGTTTGTGNFQIAARMLGVRLLELKASAEREFDAVFAALRQQQAGGLVIGADQFFNSQIEQLAALALRNAVPTIFQYREFAAAGGLMSYGASNKEAYQLAGVYTGRILKGEKPADLPVQQATRIELTINMKTAKALGLTFPLTLLGRADEVIE